MNEVSDEFSWLDREPDETPVPRTPVQPLTQQERTDLKWLLDKVPKKALAKVNKAEDRRYARLALLVHDMSMRQKMFMKALVNNQLHPPTALKALRNVPGFKGVHGTTVARWVQSPRFKEAFDLYSTLMLEASGITPASTLMRLDKLVEGALTPKPILYKGEETGHDEVDYGTAMRGVELLGKAVGVFKDEDKSSTGAQGPAFVIQIVSPNDASVIDVTPGVNVELPAPDDGA